MPEKKKKYTHDMSKEKTPSQLLPEGWRELKIVSMEERESKKGNLMFVTQVKDMETKNEQTIYLVAVSGKRWMLKKLLDAVGTPVDSDGKYIWDIGDIINRVVSGKVIHEEENWIDREGNNRTSTKSRIVDFIESTTTAWDE